MPQEDSLLILPAWLVDDPSHMPQANWGVRVVDGRINEVGPNATLSEQHPDDQTINAQESILMPGFVNAHSHLYGVLAHGIPITSAPNGFWPFLEDFWWPLVEDRLDHEMITAAADWACGEMLLTGTTTFCDVVEAPNCLPGALSAEKSVIEKWGLRGVLCFEATERLGREVGLRGLEENVHFSESCQEGDLVQPMMSIHTTFTCSDDFVLSAFELAETHDLLLHAHCNEGVHEGSWCKDKYGHRTLEHYEKLGVAGPRLLASQCVHLSNRERELITERGIRCVHMPLANCEVGGGIAPVPELLNAGATIGLGSDGYVNDLFEVLRATFLIHKGRLQDPRVMPPSQVLKMATLDGACALGVEGVGILQPGWSADLQLVDARFPTPVTAENLLEQIVLYRSGHHVQDVMVAGTWRVRGGKLLENDLEVCRNHLHKQAQRLWESNE